MHNAALAVAGVIGPRVQTSEFLFAPGFHRCVHHLMLWPGSHQTSASSLTQHEWNM
jgi:hypothetical protein